MTFGLTYAASIYGYDSSLFLAINNISSNPDLAFAAFILTQFGSEIVIGLLGVSIYAMFKTKRNLTFVIFLAIIITDLTLFLLKSWYFRPRPYEVLSNVILPIGQDQGSSFPSGHTARAFAFASVVVIRQGRRYSSIISLAILVAISRMMLGVHYPLDVLGGALLGIFIGIMSVKIIKRVISQ
jgi:undecaprenyl-diphosphatase